MQENPDIMEDDGMALQMQLANWLELSEKRTFRLFWALDTTCRLTTALQ
jgi:hypothetical protein